MVLDITCPPAPVVRHTARNSSNALYGTVIEYTTDTGWWFTNHHLVHLITCLSNGSWSNEMPDVNG